MRAGDFTELAQQYHHRGGYSHTVLRVIGTYIGAFEDGNLSIVDVGAGTGKLTEDLFEIGLRCRAVEPNDAMRAEGIKYTNRFQVEWSKGSGEDTGLAGNSKNWILMGSSFHWVDMPRGLAEFHRVLQPGGIFTALWNPRNLEVSEFHRDLERKIQEIVPELERKSSGSAQYTANLAHQLCMTGHFHDPFFVEAEHELVVSVDRFLGAWRSVNDIQSQAGSVRWDKILTMIEDSCRGLEEVRVPYKTRAWTVRRVD